LAEAFRVRSECEVVSENRGEATVTAEQRPAAKSGGGIAAMFRSILGQQPRVPSAAARTPGSRRWKDLARLLPECERGVGGEAAARARIGKVLHFYREAGDDEKRYLLELLNDTLSADPAKVRTAIDAYLRTDEPKACDMALESLRSHLDAPRLKLLGQFNLVPDGVAALVRLRADLQRLEGEKGRFAALDRDLVRLFAAWFDIGFLELRRIGWNSSAALLEKLIRYEAVHEITSWNDLRNRLDSDRRCYAFFHPRMPDEPLIFIEVALLREVATNVRILLDESQPTLDPGAASVAVFYSISNTQPGLKGISFGEFLIKRVVEQLQMEFPGLKTFATLSPVPSFMNWLMRQNVEEQKRSLPPELEFICSGDADARARLLQSAIVGDRGKPVQRGVEAWLCRQCAHYLLAERRGHEPLDPVGRFHFSNGASLMRINWLADTSARGLRQSGGLMVNYLYSLSEIENNHEAYRGTGALAAARQVRRLLDR
jgi:malonyl-CoA decarboxylase